MSALIGSARIDENGKASGGKAGDQKQKSAPDMKGEVSLENFYIAKKGWNIIRCKDADIAERISDMMVIACNNINIGYSQSERYGIIKSGIKTSSPTNCDCSSLVRAVVKEASGKDPGDFNTANEAAVLLNTGMFVVIPFTSEKLLQKGDILVTKTKGHTAVVVSTFDNSSGSPASHSPFNYKANHIYTVWIDNLNVRAKLASDKTTSFVMCKITRKLNTNDRVTCLMTQVQAGQTWMLLGTNSNGQEEWCCADTGTKAYIR